MSPVNWSLIIRSKVTGQTQPLLRVPFSWCEVTHVVEKWVGLLVEVWIAITAHWSFLSGFIY